MKDKKINQEITPYANTKMKTLTLIITVLLISCVPSFSQIPMGYVNPYVDVITYKQLKKISKRLEQFDKNNGIALELMILDSITSYEGNIYNYAKGLAENTGNDRIIVVISTSENKVGIGTSISLDSKFSNKKRQETITIITEQLKIRKYYKGIKLGIKYIIKDLI